jgi:penicillin-binding protein 1A
VGSTDLVPRPRQRALAVIPQRSKPAADAQRPPLARTLLRWGVPVLAVVILGVLAGIGVAAAIHMPAVDTVSELNPSLITRLYDQTGQAYRDYALQSRELLKEGEVPELLEKAVLAKEDQTFLSHGGIDALGAVRAAITDIRLGRKEQGASTLTMQLARKLFLKPDKTWRRKIEEILLAVDLEKTLSKQQILTLYLNVMPFGHGTYGAEAAARYYFNESVSDLTLAEVATLVAILPRPSDWTPYRKPDVVEHYRNLTIAAMLDQGYITQEQHDAAVAEPLLVVKSRPKRELGAYFAEEVRRDLYATYGEHGLYERGLQVRTTLDRDMQEAAESALRRGLVNLDQRRGWRGPLLRLPEEDVEAQQLPSWSELSFVPGAWAEGVVLEAGARTARIRIGEQDYTLTGEGIEWTRREQPRTVLRRGDVAWFELRPPEEREGGDLILRQEPELEGAAVLIESASGAVRAMIGGWDFERNEFNRATQARRQPGSSFKPFVFGAALEAGFTAADTLFDAPAVFSGTGDALNYSPRNFYRKYYGITTLRRALEKSINVTSVKLLDLVGAEQVVDFAHRAGIRSELPPYPSLALGSADLSPLEVAAAYAAVANQGIHVEPYLIESVATPDGRLLEEHHPQASKAMEPQIAYVLTHLLEGVIDRGTGYAAHDLDLDLAGKTGTTDGFTDAWFAGFSPRYTLVVWVGFDLKKTIGRNMTGAEAALPVWRDIMAKGLEDGWLKKGERFSVPPGISFRRVEYLTGLLPGRAQTQTIEEAFVAGTEPVQEYGPRWAMVMNLPWYQQRAFYGVPKDGENMPEDITDWSLVVEARQVADRRRGAQGTGE